MIHELLLVSCPLLFHDKNCFWDGNLTGISHEISWYVLICQNQIADGSQFILICFYSQTSWKNISCSWQIGFFYLTKFKFLCWKFKKKLHQINPLPVKIEVWLKFQWFKFLKRNIKSISKCGSPLQIYGRFCILNFYLNICNSPVFVGW